MKVRAALAQGYACVVPGLDDYLDLTVSQARDQYRRLASRRPVPGKRVIFSPVETLLCLAASFVVNPRQFGGTNVHRAPQPVAELARLFSRSPSSVLEKMRNLNGSRPHGARWDVLAGARLRDDPAHFSRIYRVLMAAARAEGIGPDQLPDFLGLEHGGELALLGQEELSLPVIEEALHDAFTRMTDAGEWKEEETEQIVLGAVRVGQHVFARNVLANCTNRCVFCGFTSPPAPDGKRLLLAGHIKPWKDSSPRERLDPRNGLAACPAHDAAFDKGMITVNGGLRIHLASSLAHAVQADPLARQFYGRPPLREALLLPTGAQMPARKYLDWHRKNIFAS
jgi:putative restriction endonuclease